MKYKLQQQRHTYGTRCIEAGMRAVALQRLMGHTDVSITLNTYTSVFNKYKQSELDKVNNYYLDNALLSSRKIECPKEIEKEPKKNKKIYKMLLLLLFYIIIYI